LRGESDGEVSNWQAAICLSVEATHTSAALRIAAGGGILAPARIAAASSSRWRVVAVSLLVSDGQWCVTDEAGLNCVESLAVEFRI
jgi:hypothetical protein